MSDNDGGMASYLASHPRMAGALLTLLLVLSQVGTVSANYASTIG